MNFKKVVDMGLELIETPIWDDRRKGVYWTDLFGGVIHFYDPGTGSDQTWETGKLIGAAIPTSDAETLLCALEDGLYMMDLGTGELQLLVNPEPENEDNRFNDTRVDGKGRIYLSSVSKKYGTDMYQPDMTGSFYMVDTDGSVHVIEEKINQYNGIAWNHDHTRMFVVDTYHECLLMYPYDLEMGITGPSSTVIRFTSQGMPDGMSIDAEDNLYVCHWTGKISVWNQEYQLIEEISTPVEYACCTGFGGKDLKDLYLATSRYCYSNEQLLENPGAGGLFVAKSNHVGTLDYYYPITNKKEKE